VSPTARRFFGCYLPVVFLAAGCLTCAMAMYASQIFFARVVLGDSSMAPDFMGGTTMWVDNTAYWTRSPRPGDIVWVAGPRGRVVRRVVAGPESTVAIAGGVVYVDDQPVTAAPSGSVGDYGPTVVPAESFFVLDDSGDAPDSRAWGPVPRSAIFGIGRFYSNAGTDGLSAVDHGLRPLPAGVSASPTPEGRTP
jgi:signal peptidase I